MSTATIETPAPPATPAAAPGLPPGPGATRALQTMAWTLRPGPFLDRSRARFGDQFTIRIGNEPPWVILSDPDAVKQVFTGDPRLLHAGEANVILKPILGEHSVLLLDEKPHMRQRKLLLPPLHGERMQRYGELMQGVAEEEVARWPRGQALTLQPRMQAVTLEVIMRAAFGLREGERLERLRDALRMLLDRTTSPATLMLINVFGPDGLLRMNKAVRLLEAVDALLLDEIRERRAAADLAERDDILSLLLQARHEDGSAMSDRELRDELMTLLVAGHETSATTLSWALERLVRHPQQLERLRAGGDEYADAVLKETLRLRPVLPVVVRRVKEPLEIGGRLLPAGVTVAPCIYLVHRRADVYPEPLRFAPERFLDAKAGTYTWFPFGGGVRRCLGASFAMFEMTIVLQVIARRLALRPARPQARAGQAAGNHARARPRRGSRGGGALRCRSSA
ncbi:MAG TPA: cytochrome P450 [Solirubrobacteraceae bacterium]|nr:cytochrome P450 [Solirubrobacteraceae bacterium]